MDQPTELDGAVIEGALPHALNVVVDVSLIDPTLVEST